jgi:hypothetical protein
MQPNNIHFVIQGLNFMSFLSRMRNFFSNKWVRIPYLILLYLFACIGAGLLLVWLLFQSGAVSSNDIGLVDPNNRYFQEMDDKYNQGFKKDSINVIKHRYEALNRILVLNRYYPLNANYILKAWTDTKDEKLTLRMLDAVDIRLKGNSNYQLDLAEMKGNLSVRQNTNLSVFEWMNIAEWQAFKAAVVKDKFYIDSASKASGVEPRLIVACLVGEQIRLFNSKRESYKRYIGPLKILVVENNLSFGVTGIKENTAKNIERNLKDKNSSYYLGEKYANLLDYDSIQNFDAPVNEGMSPTVKRLVQMKNHYYSYLYTALFVKQIKMQWERAGYPIDDRPEIFASLFNLGFNKSKPKSNPEVGGSSFEVGNSIYSFGAVAFEFYYSGELQEVFPFKGSSFDFEK